MKALPASSRHRLGSAVDEATLQQSQMLLLQLETALTTFIEHPDQGYGELNHIQHTLLAFSSTWHAAWQRRLGAHMRSFASYLLRCLEPVMRAPCVAEVAEIRELVREVRSAWQPFLTEEIADDEVVSFSCSGSPVASSGSNSPKGAARISH